MARIGPKRNPAGVELSESWNLKPLGFGAERTRAAANRRAGGERDGVPDVRAARWVAAEALRELTSETARARLERRQW